MHTVLFCSSLSHCLRETNPHCSNISALYEEFTHEGTSYSFSRQKKKLNPRKQFSQLKLLRCSRAVLWKRTYFQQSPGTQAQLSVVFTVTSHSPATPACTKSGTLLMVLIQYSCKSSPCCSEQGNTKVFQWLTHNPRASAAGWSSPLRAEGWQEPQEDTDICPPQLPVQLQVLQQAAGARRPSPRGSRLLTVQSVPVSEPQPPRAVPALSALNSPEHLQRFKQKYFRQVTSTSWTCRKSFNLVNIQYWSLRGCCGGFVP